MSKKKRPVGRPKCAQNEVMQPFPLRMSAKLLKAVRQYRSTHGFGSDAEAVRQIIADHLQQFGKKR